MRKRFVAGNWKMNGSTDSIDELLSEIKTGLVGFNDADIVVFPSFVYLNLVGDLLGGSNIYFGAQNISEHDKGAYTGEISASMLIDVGCKYVLIGHSERRQFYNEQNALLALKFSVAQTSGLIPILCVGETREQRDNNKTEEIVLDQINTIINHCGISALKNSVIAYEPVWAIGTGLTATPEQVQKTHSFIRENIAEHDVNIATELRIVYGGSIKSCNAPDLFVMPDVDGGLVGGASLDAQSFVNICRVVKVL